MRSCPFRICRRFFWCSTINGILLVVSAAVCAFAGDWLYRLHGRLFSLSRESFNSLIYAFIGAYKICFLVFNLVPLAALWIMG